MELIIKTLIVREESQHRKIQNVKDYKGYSTYPSPIRPSSTCMAWDSFFRTNKEPVKNYKTKQEWRDDLLKYRAKSAAWTSAPRANLPHHVPTPEKVTFRDTSYNDQGPVKGTILTYPGAKIENGVIYWIHGGGFFLGLSLYTPYIRLLMLNRF